MALLLSLETSTTVCSVALHENERVIASAETHQPQAHATKLAVLIDQVFGFADVDRRQLAAVAVTAGPGSYTGLRIGTSTAKGLCYALSVPLISVGTLDVMAAGVRNIDPVSVLCPMIDARRMEVYCQLFDAYGLPIGPVEAKVIDEQSFAQELGQQQIVFFGSGADKCRDVIRHGNARFVSGVYPSALQLGALAWRKYQQQDFADLVHFEPFYLKEFMIKKPAPKAPVNPAMPNNFA